MVHMKTILFIEKVNDVCENISKLTTIVNQFFSSQTGMFLREKHAIPSFTETKTSTFFLMFARETK